jgi:flagellar basal body-associated protein FliL
MSATATKTTTATGKGDSAPSGRRPGMMLLVGIVAAVGLIQALMTVFLMLHLSAEQPAVVEPLELPPEAEGHGASPGHAAPDHGDSSDHGAGDHGAADNGHGRAKSELEVDLGQYAATIWQPERQTSLLISFQLYGTVKAENGADFETRYEEKKHRIRERLLVAARQLSLEDITDPTLANLRALAVKIVNEGLGRRLVDSVVVSEFVHAEK